MKVEPSKKILKMVSNPIENRVMEIEGAKVEHTVITFQMMKVCLVRSHLQIQLSDLKNTQIGKMITKYSCFYCL